MEQQTQTTSSEPNHKITFKEMTDRIGFWPEIFPFIHEFKFVPFGSTSLDVPEFHRKNIAKVATTASVNDLQYGELHGRRDLRESILNNFPECKRFQEAGINLTPDNFLITSGVVGGIAACIDRLCGPDQETILIDPIYPFHMSKVIAKHLPLKSVRMNYNSDTATFQIDYEGLRRTLNSKSRLLILCNPNNPACTVYTREEYQKISEIIRDYPDLIVIEDAAYFLYYTDGHQPIPYAVVNPQDFERTITFYSAGKMYNVTGTRIGIAISTKAILDDLVKIFFIETQMPATLEQLIIREDMVSANEKNERGLDFYEETRRDVVRRGNLIADELKGHGLKVVKDDGSYYILFDVEEIRGKLDDKYYYKLDEPEVKTPELDKAFCRMLFLEKKVGFFPLSQLYFGHNIPDNLVRVSKNRNDEDLKFMIDSCKDVLKKIRDSA